MLKTFQFVAVMCSAIAMAAGLAHLMEMPHKMAFPRADYLVVQQIYRGWAMLGIVIIAALLACVLAALKLRGQGARFWLTAGAGACIAAALAVFFAFTFPANQATANWTVLPDDWEALRRQWEYSHAAAAVLYVLAVALLTLSLLCKCEQPYTPARKEDG